MYFAKYPKTLDNYPTTLVYLFQRRETPGEKAKRAIPKYRPHRSDKRLADWNPQAASHKENCTMTVATIATQKTVRIEHCDAATIRCTANQDMPEYGIEAGEVFYLVRSSKNDGSYYVARWSADLMTWQDTCPSRIPCRHTKLVSTRCQMRAQARKQTTAPAREHSLTLNGKPATDAEYERIMGHKPKQRTLARGEMGNQGFSLLRTA
jgi:hypothetical protein